MPTQKERNRREYQKKWCAENKDKVDAYQKEWYRKNRDRVLAYGKENRAKRLADPTYLAEYRAKAKQAYYNNREARLAQRKQYYWEHREEEKAKNRSYYHKLRLECLIAYGGNPPQCACCGERYIEFLTIDHIIGGGHQHRLKLKGGGQEIYRYLRKANFPLGYRVLCWNCNVAIGFYGICPHQRK